ncbi:MAG TPA: hypothetical protein VFS27_12735, partial [Blastocatellia bacterium]|nr:hypothetical protein [Blastocatellia bacterium]
MPLEKQFLTRKQIAQLPYRKQEVGAYTRRRVIVMNGIEMEAFAFSPLRITGRQTCSSKLSNLPLLPDRIRSSLSSIRRSMPRY